MNRLVIGILLGAVGLWLVWAGLALPLRGDNQSPASQHVSPYYIEKAYEQTHTPNLVSAVLADYRSFDTLGETLVIFTAGLACWLVMGARKEQPNA